MKFDVPKEVVNKLFKNGYEDQIIDIVMSFQNDDNREISDIPLSPLTMQDSGKKIIISDEVYQNYQRMVKRISNSSTAQEIPYFLLGNNKKINGENFVYIEKIEFCNQNELDDLKVSIDVEKFKNIVINSQYDVISIGHTHGNVSEDKKYESMTRNIPSNIIQKYDIRDIGLNISVSDVWQQEAFKQIASQCGSEKEIMQTVIMYNGDIIMMSPDGISKSNNVHTISNGNIISLSTGLTDEKINTQIRQNL